jgi:HD superfamily phosphodiesterase
MEKSVLLQMIQYFGTDVPRINHALKVYGYAQTIAFSQNLTPKELQIIEFAAILHDIGIPISEKKYGSCSGNYQEIEGPPIAKEILKQCSISEEIIERVCYIISKHHTLQAIDGIDFQIIIEADFLVNAFEETVSKKSIEHMKNTWFKTEEGMRLVDVMFLK